VHFNVGGSSLGNRLNAAQALTSETLRRLLLASRSNLNGRLSY
jgi:hypothetical protein